MTSNSGYRALLSPSPALLAVAMGVARALKWLSNLRSFIIIDTSVSVSLLVFHLLASLVIEHLNSQLTLSGEDREEAEALKKRKKNNANE